MKIDITPSVSIFGTYKNFKYNVSTALFEYYDNSTSSFFEEGNRKDDRYIITLIDRRDKSNKKMYVIDNAFGMTDKDFVRAIKIDNKQKQTQRNKFGVGLKVSAIWFSDIWSVQTLGQKQKKHRKFIFDLNEIQNSQKKVFESIDITEKNIGGQFGLNFEHGTIIELQSPRELPTDKATVMRLVDGISNQFSEDIKNQNVKFMLVEITDDNLGNVEFVDIYEKYYGDDSKAIVKTRLLDCSPIEEKKIEWYKIKGIPIFEEVDINVEDFENEKTYNITGVVGWRKDSGVSKGGFKRIWNGRALEVNDWKPSRVVGLSNSYTGQRLYGVLDFSEFEPSNSKDEFLISASLEVEIEDKLNAAFKSIKSKINKFSKEQAKAAKELKAAKIERSFDKSDKKFIDMIDAFEAESVISKASKIGKNKIYSNTLKLEPKQNISIEAVLSQDFDNADLILLESVDEKTWKFNFKINAQHKIFKFASEDNIGNITDLIKVVCFSEAKAMFNYYKNHSFENMSHITNINKSLKEAE